VSNVAEQLQGFSALKTLSEEHLQALSGAVQETNYRSGSWLVRDGDVGTSCFFLLAGTVSVSKQLEDGRKVYLSTLIAGHLFGQTGLIPNQVRTADVTATSDVTVLVLERARLEAELDRGTGWATALQTIIASHLVRQLRNALGRLESLAGQEDAEDAATGRKHSQVAQPKSFKMDFSASPTSRARIPEESEPAAMAEPERQPETDSGEWDALPPPEPVAPAQDNTRKELFELLQATEAGLGTGTDYQLSTVRVVVEDEDAWGRRAL